MRIRRRPQPPGSSLQLQAASDLATITSTSTTAPQTPQNNAARNRGWLLAPAAEDEDRAAKLLHAAGADLVLGQQKSGVARRLALPQEDNVVEPVADCGGGRSMGGGADDDDCGRMRFSAANGHGGGSEHKDGGATCTTGGVGGRYEPAVVAEERATSKSNGFVLQPAAVVKDEVKQQATSNGNGNGTGANKKRRGPAVLLEGSRCSRVNGRGWRCSQPTLVGYSLCEHHLGKGRMRSAAAAAAARGNGGTGAVVVGRLGRTEHGASRTIAAAGAGAAAAGVVNVTPAALPPPPKAEGPSLPGC